MLPERVVPAGIGGIGNGEHPIRGYSAAPETESPTFFHPYIAPVTVCRFLDHLDINSGLGSAFFVKHGSVHRSGKGGVGGVQLKCSAFEPGLFQMKLGLVRVEFSLGQFRGIKALILSNRMVVAHCSVTTQNSFHHLLTVHGVFQRQSGIIVVPRFNGCNHRYRIVLCAV